MTPESSPIPESPLEPTPETVAEMSFGTAVRKAVDDLFTCEAIAQKLQQFPATDVIEPLLESWKQGLSLHLQAEAAFRLESVVANLNLIQTEGSEAFSETERLEWERIEQWYTDFSVVGICREDLKGILPEPVIAGLSDEVMHQIAQTLWHNFYDNQSYWDNLASATRMVLEQPQVSPTPSAKP